MDGGSHTHAHTRNRSSADVQRVCARWAMGLPQTRALLAREARVIYEGFLENYGQSVSAIFIGHFVCVWLYVYRSMCLCV